jgi:hypothetical protein
MLADRDNRMQIDVDDCVLHGDVNITIQHITSFGYVLRLLPRGPFVAHCQISLLDGGKSLAVSILTQQWCPTTWCMF